MEAADATQLTLEDARLLLERQRRDIDTRLAFIEELMNHLSPPVQRVEIVRLGETNEASAQVEVDEDQVIKFDCRIGAKCRIPATRAGRKYEVGHQITLGGGVVGYIGRRRQGSWDAMDANYQQLGHAATKGVVLQLVADNQ